MNPADFDVDPLVYLNTDKIIIMIIIMIWEKNVYNNKVCLEDAQVVLVGLGGEPEKFRIDTHLVWSGPIRNVLHYNTHFCASIDTR